MHKIHFFFDRVKIPWFYSRNTDSICFLNSFGCGYHDIAVYAVASECCNSVFGTCRYENVIIGYISLAITVVQLYGTDRSGKKWILKCLVKQFQTGINWFVLCDCSNLEAEFFPLVIVADGSIADSFTTRSRHLVTTGFSIAFRTGFTVVSDSLSCLFDTF